MITLTDMFCGAGGSSTGAISVPGVEVRTAMNHWARAIETHNANHQDTTHVCADISQTDPRYVADSDILWASPECTNHSVARGRKRATNQPDLFGDTIADEAAERSRATMWDVPRFAEHHDYKLIITENVVDAARWVMFDAWLMAMHSLGYNHHIVYLNSMHAQLGGLPAPQSRDRMYVMFWKKGNPAPDFDRLRPEAYCPACDKTVKAMQVFKRDRWGRYKSQYVYRCPNTSCRNQIIEPGWLPAAYAIDWTLRGQRIGDRPRPLAEKTMRRIKAGLDKYGTGHGPLIVNHLSGSDTSRTATVRDTLRTLAAGGLHESLLIPVEGRAGKDARHAMEAMRTQTTRNETALLVPAGGTWRTGATSTAAPMPTRTTRETDGLLTVPNDHAMVTLRGQNAPKSVTDPMDTFAANGTHHGLMTTNVPKVEDCEFRMLEPHEIMRGMAFPHEYIMTGNKREQVKQSGNAVTPPAARDLITIGAESLEGVS